MKVKASTKILFIDDSLEARQVFKTILAKKGFKNIHLADDAQHAKEMIDKAWSDKDPFDIVLADYHMPEVDGLQFFHKIKDMPNFIGTPYIIVTADNDKDHVIEIISAGVNNYVLKPYTAQVLLEKIWKTLEKIPEDFHKHQHD